MRKFLARLFGRSEPVPVVIPCAQTEKPKRVRVSAALKLARQERDDALAEWRRSYAELEKLKQWRESDYAREVGKLKAEIAGLRAALVAEAENANGAQRALDAICRDASRLWTTEPEEESRV